jgi:hypothetical protein
MGHSGSVMSAIKSDDEMPADFDLGIPEDVLALAERFEGEWYNGGFAQLFSNWYPADVELIPAALKAIGAPEAAAVVQSAIDELGPRAQWREQGHRALVDPADPLRPRLWDLNRKFDEYADRLISLIAEYEKKLSEETEEGNDT